jgi:hypothetical protein
MTSFSLRAALRTARSAVAQERVSLRQHLQTSWRRDGASSLREALTRMMIDPGMSRWTLAAEGIFRNNEWQHHCQGVACDGTAWYITRDDASVGRVLVKFSLDFKQQLVRWDPGTSLGHHLGDPDVGRYDGAPCIFAPFEKTPRGTGRIAVLSPELKLVADSYLEGEHGGPPPTAHKAPWVAFHPGNQLIYTSLFEVTQRLEAYDPARGFRHVPEESIELDRRVTQVQGGTFNRSGHVFLAQERVAEIWGFSTLTGAFLGAVPFEMHDGGLRQEMAEGLCWAPLQVAGKRASLHFTLLDRDLVGGDDMFLKHFATGELE